MNILLLSPYPEDLYGAFSLKERYIVVREDLDIPCSDDGVQFDWIISYGCRTIIKGKWLEKYKGKIINIHIGYLPWNRGADPNFWSWFDDTPKGVSIHEIDGGIDTGLLYSRAEIKFDNIRKETLRSSYKHLRAGAAFSFHALWPSIRDGLVTPTPQPNTGGSYHRAIDKVKWFDHLPLEYDTPVSTIVELGKRSRENV